MREEDDRQGSLFGGEAFGPPPPRLRASAPPVARTPRPLEPAPAPVELAPDSPESLREPTPASLDSAAGSVFGPPEEAEAEIRVSRARRPSLDGPTLDDAVSHAWEALVARVPAACPVCHNEIEPAPAGALQGRCQTCNVTLD
jgi:hypothetical protein